MPPLVVETPFERLVAEQAVALAREVQAAAGSAPPGRILDRLEATLLLQGRDFLARVLTAAAQQTADDAAKKGVPLEPVPADTRPGTREPHPGRS